MSVILVDSNHLSPSFSSMPSHCLSNLIFSSLLFYSVVFFSLLLSSLLFSSPLFIRSSVPSHLSSSHPLFSVTGSLLPKFIPPNHSNHSLSFSISPSLSFSISLSLSLPLSLSLSLCFFLSLAPCLPVSLHFPPPKCISISIPFHFPFASSHSIHQLTCAIKEISRNVVLIFLLTSASWDQIFPLSSGFSARHFNTALALVCCNTKIIQNR